MGTFGAVESFSIPVCAHTWWTLKLHQWDLRVYSYRDTLIVTLSDTQKSTAEVGLVLFFHARTQCLISTGADIRFGFGRGDIYSTSALHTLYITFLCHLPIRLNWKWSKMQCGIVQVPFNVRYMSTASSSCHLIDGAGTWHQVHVLHFHLQIKLDEIKFCISKWFITIITFPTHIFEYQT